MLLGALGLGAAAIYLMMRAPTDPRPSGQEREPAEGGGSATSLAASPDGATVIGARCTIDSARPGFHIREQSQAAPAPAPPASLDGGDEPEEPLGIPSIVLGRATRTSAAYVVGLRRDVGNESLAELASVDPHTGEGRLISLGRIRGDLDAPLAVADGSNAVAAILEPNASGYALRLSRVIGSDVRPAAEIDQQRDESESYDVALGAAHAVVAWDEITKAGDRSAVLVATLDRAELGNAGKPRVVSGKDTDAEVPQLVARDSGFWLAYVARRPLELAKRPTDKELDKDPDEDRHPAEMIQPSWIELVALDEAGEPTAPPRLLTPRTGHVQAFDLALGSEGGAMLAWRDDDTPTGSEGGRLSFMTVSPGGGTEEQVVADENIGLGAPSLLPGWLVATDTEGRARLAPLSPEGELLGQLRTEPALGIGQVLAADADSVLVAQTVAGGVDLLVARCDRKPDPPTPVAPKASATGGP